MEFKLIEALFTTACGSDVREFPGYVSTQGAQKSRERAERLLARMDGADPGARPTGAELGDAFQEEEAEWEFRGFVNGFRLGVQIMRECTCPAVGGEAGVG